MKLNNIKNLKANDIILLLFFLLLACMNMFFNKNLGDDYGFSLILTKESIFEFTIRHFFTWSSRNLIEIPLVIFTYLPIVFFRIVNTALLFSLTVFIIKMFEMKSPAVVAFVCLGVFSYSYFDFTSAGWVTTFICMFWAYAIGTICLSVALKSTFSGENSKAAVLLSCIGMLYACNLELVCVYFLVVYLGLIIYSKIAGNKINKVLFYHLGIIILNLIYILLNPGNQARTDFTIASYYHDFHMKSLLVRVHEGVSWALLSVFLDVNVFMLILCVVLVFAVFTKYKKGVMAHCYRFFSIALLFLVFALNLSYNYIELRYFFHDNAHINPSNVNSLTPYLTFMFLCVLFLMVIAYIYIALGHNKNSFIALLLVIAGFASAACLGLTAGIAVSGARAYVSLKFSLILASIIIFKDMYPNLTKAQKTLFSCALLILGGFALFIMLEGFSLI